MAQAPLPATEPPPTIAAAVTAPVDATVAPVARYTAATALREWWPLFAEVGPPAGFQMWIGLPAHETSVAGISLGADWSFELREGVTEKWEERHVDVAFPAGLYAAYRSRWWADSVRIVASGRAGFEEKAKSVVIIVPSWREKREGNGYAWLLGADVAADVRLSRVSIAPAFSAVRSSLYCAGCGWEDVQSTSTSVRLRVDETRDASANLVVGFSHPVMRFPEQELNRDPLYWFAELSHAWYTPAGFVVPDLHFSDLHAQEKSRIGGGVRVGASRERAYWLAALLVEREGEEGLRALESAFIGQLDGSWGYWFGRLGFELDGTFAMRFSEHSGGYDSDQVGVRALVQGRY
jgi:hypothetical protein